MTTPRRELLAIYEFADLVATSSRSARQRERVVRAARVPVTGSGIVVLREVERHGPLAPSDLARRLELDQSTVSRQVKPLEDQGLVRRAVDRSDRRVARLAVTTKGRNLLDRVRDVALHDFDVALADWSDEDRALLVDLLDRFRQALVDGRVDAAGWSADPSRREPA